MSSSSTSKLTSVSPKAFWKDFPLLENRDIAYLDNAATLQKPDSVIKSMDEFYRTYNSNVHRSAHRLAEKATEGFESARKEVAKFLGNRLFEEIVFTRGTTEAINLVASSYGRFHLKEGDRILVSRAEHHANFVPWQALAKRRKLQFEILELDSDFRVSLKDLEKALARKPKILAIQAMSNVTGVVHPIADILRLAKKAGVVTVVDVAQFAAHYPIEEKKFADADFLAFSAHKIGGPTGIGALAGRHELLEKMPPIQFGGEMILEVHDQDTIFNEVPYKFEAGTPAIAEAIGLKAALQYIDSVGFQAIEAKEKLLTERGLEILLSVPDLHLIGPKEPKDRGPLFSFVFDGIHAHDLGTFLDARGICVRGGHHCAQPLHFHLKVAASTRASLSFYNEVSEIEKLKDALLDAKKFFARGK